MLLIADNKFGNKLNLKKNFYCFYKLFEDLKPPENKTEGVKSPDEMEETLLELKALDNKLKQFKNIEISKKKRWFANYIRGYTDKLYKSTLKPIQDKEIYIVGDTFSKKQGWIEGSLETCYDVIKLLSFDGYKTISSKSTVNY